MYSLRTIIEATELPSEDLVSSEDVIFELGLTLDTDGEALLARQITRVSQSLAEFCDRRFCLLDVVETFVFQDLCEIQPLRQPLVLWQYPVREITEVLVGDTEVTDYEFDPESGRLWRTEGTWSGRVQVTYSGGYDLPDEAPGALASAAIEAVRQRRIFAERDPSVREVSYSHGDTSHSKGYYSAPDGSAGFSSTIIDVIKPFRRLSLA